VNNSVTILLFLAIVIVQIAGVDSTITLPTSTTVSTMPIVMAPTTTNTTPLFVANFTATPPTGVVPLPVSFTATSTGIPVGWEWFFGEKNYNQVWNEQTASANWTKRDGFCSVVMPDGSIVLMGGEVAASGSNAFRNDTWRSTDEGATWTLVNVSAGWQPRSDFSCVVMPNGDIVIMGGFANLNDIWRSTDEGAHWTLLNASSGWSGRWGHSSFVMPDGSIVLMGGGYYPYGRYCNDTWRSTDEGAHWTLLNASSGWSARRNFAAVLMPDGNIIMMGGRDNSSIGDENDTWRSTDDGATWTLVNTSSGWIDRYSHFSVSMPDGSIVLMGGYSRSSGNYLNDTWRSTDDGATWTEINKSSGWSVRYAQSSVAMPDGSIVLMGGYNYNGNTDNYLNDTWRFQPGAHRPFWYLLPEWSSMGRDRGAR